MTSPVVRTVRLREDVGVYEPVYRVTDLQLHADGTVTWLRSSGTAFDPQGLIEPEVSDGNAAGS